MAVIVVNHVSLDGVMQGPGRPDEDTRGGFGHGGWAVAPDDPAISEIMGAAMGTGFVWLFGHRSYDDMLTHWNEAGGPFKDGLNERTKYVATSDPRADPPWPNSSPLSGDVPAAVAALRQESRGNLIIMGSGKLVRSLLPHGLIDEIVLLIHPLTLGNGQRLFPDDGVLRRFSLETARVANSGIIVTRYRLRGAGSVTRS